MVRRAAHPAARFAAGPAAHAATRSAARRGLTLIELLVSVGVLAIMILAFNLVLVPSQRLVSKSTTTMRVNNAAAAIADLLRDDLRQASQMGFLCITWGYDAEGVLGPRLVFTAPGPARSMTSDVQGTGRLVCVGMSPDYLWRQGWVVSADGDATEPTDDRDVIAPIIYPYTDIGYLQSLSRYDDDADWDIAEDTLDDLLKTDGGTERPGPPDFSVEDDPEQWQWQVLADHPVALSIMWTDGTLDDDDNLYWYGIDYEIDDNGTEDVLDDDIVTYTNYRQQSDGSSSDDGEWADHEVEDRRTEYGDDNGHYRALWTHEDQRNWPTAIKIRYTVNVKDDSSRRTLGGARGFRQMTYEVICPLGS